MNRRDLMKWFGVGAVVAPVVNGLAMADNHATLIEAPKVEIAQPPKLIPVIGARMFKTYEPLAVTVFARNQQDNTVFRMDCTAFMTGMNLWADPRGPNPVMQMCTFEATGPVQFAEVRSR